MDQSLTLPTFNNIDQSLTLPTFNNIDQSQTLPTFNNLNDPLYNINFNTLYDIPTICDIISLKPWLFCLLSKSQKNNPDLLQNLINKNRKNIYIISHESLNLSSLKYKNSNKVDDIILQYILYDKKIYDTFNYIMNTIKNYNFSLNSPQYYNKFHICSRIFIPKKFIKRLTDIKSTEFKIRKKLYPDEFSFFLTILTFCPKYIKYTPFYYNKNFIKLLSTNAHYIFKIPSPFIKDNVLVYNHIIHNEKNIILMPKSFLSKDSFFFNIIKYNPYVLLYYKGTHKDLLLFSIILQLLVKNNVNDICISNFKIYYKNFKPSLFFCASILQDTLL